jgi:hypothetical protein
MREATAPGRSGFQPGTRSWPAAAKWLAVVYALVFGVAGPLACFGVVVHVNSLADWSGPVFLYAVLAVAALLAWLTIGRKRETVDALLGGALLAASGFAILCSLILVPLALFAVMAVAKEPGIAAIGLMGFLPPLALPAFALPAWRAIASARSGQHAALLCALGFAASLSFPIAVHETIDRACRCASQSVLATSRPLDELDLERWRLFARGRRWDELIDAYRLLRDSRSLDDPRALRIADAYERATGKPIRWRFYD